MPVSSKRTLTQRAEMFGFDDGTRWALPAIRLLFAAPRAFEPLVEAWESRNPGTLSSLEKLRSQGFAANQPPVFIDTVSGAPAASSSRPVAAYRLTAAGCRLALESTSDIRVLQDLFPKSDLNNLTRISKLLSEMHSRRQGDLRLFSAKRASNVSGFGERHMRMWLERLLSEGVIAVGSTEHKDIFKAAPAHWRPTSQLIRQLKDIAADPAAQEAAAVLSDLLLERRRELPPISIDAEGYSGSSDFDHDVRSQELVAAFISRSGRIPPNSIIRMEPPLRLPASRVEGGLSFTDHLADSVSYYRPDAEFRETHEGIPIRSILEYERRQSRSDAWAHIESFAGWMHVRSFPFEEGHLRFVVDSSRRSDVYFSLCKDYARMAEMYPDSVPRNALQLSVTTTGKVLAADNPFEKSLWRTVHVRGTGKGPVMLNDEKKRQKLREML